MGTGETIEPGLYVISRYLFYSETAFAFVTILCICMGIMLTGFGLYHVNLAMNNVTTNESYKRAAFETYFEEKIDFLEQWKEFGDGFKFEEREKKLFEVDEKWTKQ